jgi:hypothetical protein
MSLRDKSFNIVLPQKNKNEGDNDDNNVDNNFTDKLVNYFDAMDEN